MLYMVLQLPLGIIYFTIIVTALTLSAAVTALPIAQVVIGQPIIRDFDYGYLHRAVGDAAGRGFGDPRLLRDALDREGHRVRARALGQDDAGGRSRCSAVPVVGAGQEVMA